MFITYEVVVDGRKYTFNADELDAMRTFARVEARTAQNQNVKVWIFEDGIRREFFVTGMIRGAK